MFKEYITKKKTIVLCLLAFGIVSNSLLIFVKPFIMGIVTYARYIKNIENNSYDERLEESPEFHRLMSDLNSEIDRLQSEDPNKGNKLFSVFFMVNDWADYVSKIRRAKQDSYGEKIDPLNATASENIDEKATRLQLICPDINIPDYSE